MLRRPGRLALATLVIAAASAAGAACAPAARPAASAPTASVVPAAPAASAAPTPAPPAARAAACASAEHRQFDFWIGEWDLVLQARLAPDKDEWAEARGTQRIEAILGGCAIAEHFRADGPGTPWAGESYSVWQPTVGKWRQTWVDDQGGYLAFTGGLVAGVMTLEGEPQTTRKGVEVRMRMVFLDVTRDALRWEWQRSVDGGATWAPQLIIVYTRHVP